MILCENLQYSDDANGFDNPVPTTATMLFHLGKKISYFIFHIPSSFFFFLFFSFLPVKKTNPFLAIGGLVYFHELGFAFQPPSHGISDWVMLEIHLGR